MTTITKSELDGMIAEKVGEITGGLTPEEFRQMRAENKELKKLLEQRETAELAEKTQDGFHKSYRKRASALLKTDRHNGLGLQSARFFRAVAVGKITGKNPAAVAKSWGSDWLADLLDGEKRAQEVAQLKALGVEVGADGGYLVPEELRQELIPLLRAAQVLGRMGVTRIPMRHQQLKMPRITSGATSTYVGENSGPNATAMQFGQLTLLLKKLMTIVPMSNEFYDDPSAEADAVVRDDIVRSMGLRRDLAGIRGDGQNDTPRGIRHLMSASNAKARTQSGASSTLTEIVADLFWMVEQVEGANVPLDRAGWIMRSRTKSGLARLLDGNGNFVFMNEIMNGQLLGFPVFISNQIPTNLGAGDETELYFGAADQFLHGEGRAMEIKAYDGGTYKNAAGQLVSGLTDDQTIIRAKTSDDNEMRNVEAFARLDNVDWGVSP